MNLPRETTERKGSKIVRKLMKVACAFMATRLLMAMLFVMPYATHATLYDGIVTYYSYNKVNVSGSELPFTHPSLTSRWAPYWWTMPVSGAKVERVNCLATVVKVEVPGDSAVLCEMCNVSAPRSGPFYADVYTSDPSASSAPSPLYSQTMGSTASPSKITIPDQAGYGYGKTYWVRIHYEPSSRTVDNTYTATFDLQFSRGEGSGSSGGGSNTPTSTLSEIRISGSSELFPGGYTNYTCTAIMSDGTSKIVSATWSIASAPANRAEINAFTGKLSSNKWSDLTSTVDVTIKASYSEGGVTKTATKVVTILVPIKNITISGADNIKAGDSKSYTCVANMANGVTKNVAAKWSIDTGWTYGSISADGVLNAYSTAAGKEIIVKAIHTEGIVTCSRTKTISVLESQSTVTISFNSDGGSSCGSQQYTVGGTYGTLPSPTKSGYTFAGWYSNSSLTTRVYASTTVSASVTTLYAKWEEVQPQTVTVSFNSNGGSSCSSREYTIGSTYGTLPTPTKNTYNFEGWYSNSSFATRITTSSNVSSDITTLYAKWVYVGSSPILTIENGTLIKVELNGCTGVIIPNSVTSIGEHAFRGCSELTNVTIPDSVKNIGDYAFTDCSNLASVTIPNSVTNIGVSAFLRCYKLTGTLVIPDSVTTIGENSFYVSGLTSVIIGKAVLRIGTAAFSKCVRLRSFSVDNANVSFSSVNGMLLSKNGRILIQGINCDVEIPSTVYSIRDSAFSYCTGLENITIPSSVTSIGDSAFEGCGVTNITIPNSVTIIGETGWLIDGPNIPGRPFWVMRHRTPLLT